MGRGKTKLGQIMNSTPLIIKVANVMKEVDKMDSLWYQDESINNIIDIAVRRGWLNRWSVTQVHWTELGVLEYKNTRPQ
jgi:hypothetical protein